MASPLAHAFTSTPATGCAIGWSAKDSVTSAMASVGAGGLTFPRQLQSAAGAPPPPPAPLDELPSPPAPDVDEADDVVVDADVAGSSPSQPAREPTLSVAAHRI